MTEVLTLAALWLSLALAATLLSIWLRIATAMSEIIVGTVAQLAIGAPHHLLPRVSPESEGEAASAPGVVRPAAGPHR